MLDDLGGEMMSSWLRDEIIRRSGEKQNSHIENSVE